MTMKSDVYVSKMMRCGVCGQPYAYEEEDCPYCWMPMDKETFTKQIHEILKLYDYAHHDTDVMEEIGNLISQLYDQATNRIMS